MKHYRVVESSNFPLEDGQILILEPSGEKELAPDTFFAFKRELAEKGYKLLYIPYIVNAMSIDTIKYYVPDYDVNTSAEQIQSRVCAALGLEVNSPVALSKNDKYLMARELDETGGTTAMLIMTLIEKLPKRNFQEILHDIQAFAVGAVCGISASITKPMLKKVMPSEDIDELLSLVLKKNEEELREFGMSETLIQSLFEYKEVPSRIKINHHGRITLEDYNIEIKMDPKTKALFLLYLRHPEGIAQKNLSDYKEEVFDLYASLSHRDDKVAQQSTVDNLLDPLKNDKDSCLSRIKRAFLEKISDIKARNYYVSGEKGEIYNIPLDRNLVIWETIR